MATPNKQPWKAAVKLAPMQSQQCNAQITFFGAGPPAAVVAAGPVAPAVLPGSCILPLGVPLAAAGGWASVSRSEEEAARALRLRPPLPFRAASLPRPGDSSGSSTLSISPCHSRYIKSFWEAAPNTATFPADHFEGSH